MTVVKMAFLFADHLERSQIKPNEMITPSTKKNNFIFDCFRGKAVFIEGSEEYV